MLDKLTIADFKERVGQTFQATAAEGRTLSMKLSQVDELQKPIEDKGRDPFSLEFVASDPHPVPQQTLAIQHDDMGAFDLFVVPLGPAEDGMRYEAIFT